MDIEVSVEDITEVSTADVPAHTQVVQVVVLAVVPVLAQEAEEQDAQKRISTEQK